MHLDKLLNSYLFLGFNKPVDIIMYSGIERVMEIRMDRVKLFSSPYLPNIDDEDNEFILSEHYLILLSNYINDNNVDIKREIDTYSNKKALIKLINLFLSDYFDKNFVEKIRNLYLPTKDCTLISENYTNIIKNLIIRIKKSL